MDKIAPCLWFDDKIVEAVNFYVDLFPDSSIDRISESTMDTPGAQKGQPVLIEFTIAGTPMQALHGSDERQFNMAVSLSVPCDTQAELDEIWSGIKAAGGEEIMCGWIKDHYGLHWQIVPKSYFEMQQSGTPEQRARLTEAMISMIKLDEAALKAAWQKSD